MRAHRHPPAGFSLRYAYVSQRGYYPDSPDKPNQDAFCVHTNLAGDGDQASCVAGGAMGSEPCSMP
jgi:hypothetical protein